MLGVDEIDFGLGTFRSLGTVLKGWASANSESVSLIRLLPCRHPASMCQLANRGSAQVRKNMRLINQKPKNSFKKQFAALESRISDLISPRHR